jgi:ribokinase
MKWDVVCVGCCAWDCTSVVSEFPRLDAKVESVDFCQQGGGPAATAAVTLSRLGAKASFVGKVGDDHWGQMIAKGLDEEGVGTEGLIVEQGRSSPISSVIVEKGTGRRTIIFNRGTVTPFGDDELDRESVLSGKILLVDSLHPEAAYAAARLAREHGMTVVLDTGGFKPQAAALLHVANVIIAPQYFSEGFDPGTSLGDIVRYLLECGAEMVVMTQGAQGGLCYSSAGEHVYPGFRVEVVDTTGAGDVFHGAFAFGLLKKWSLEKTAAFASATAALKCTRLGGRTGIPSSERVFNFLQEQEFNFLP